MPNNTINWEESGFLYGLFAYDDIDAVRGLLEEIKLDDLKSEQAKQFMPPAIRRIYTQIQFNEGKVINVLKKNRALTEKVLAKINVQDITEQLEVYIAEYMPNAPKYLPNLDTEVELLTLFCENYIYGLIRKEQHGV